jgi:ribosomal protein S6
VYELDEHQGESIMSVEKTRNYRATFVLDTRGVETPLEELADSYRTLIAGLTGGEVILLDDQENRALARPARTGLDTAWILAFEFSGSPQAPAQLQEKVRLDRKVNRVMVELREAASAPA